ncbi:MAG: RelA/SpoT family protein [Bacteroidetes bacterium]|nr:MAG: RelA/SpoT family protein [Bacteroidota bacterium]RLD46482.1 MAG: RelA/SpoT family protein [Bacteroidota bacterium]HHL57420.1 bifunctional (p)ppGpp synthetase/guanosine-3',5'-bis(diphosphate) 3'-pyrophosphohydrolase [Bacteroidota bacterium]
MPVGNAEIEEKYTELLNSGNGNIPDAEKVKIRKAFDIACDIYRDEKLVNGKPFIFHNLEVAIIAVREIGLGSTSAICSILHNINLKSDYTLAKIRQDFGDQVAEIIEGYNQLDDLHTERISFQSETFRTLFLSLVDDIRVVLLHLAHRLYDIRHLDFLGENKGHIINEVKHLYVPIAHRLGLYKIKTEFEERVMLHEYPDVFKEIEQKIKETKTKRDLYIKEFIAPIERELIKQGIDFNIKWRTKSVPSIWAKMKRQNVDFEEVFDLFAIRIILKSKLRKEKEICWKVYSIVTDLYQPDPKRLRDWISTPKASGYESLHTTVKGSRNKFVEVQIRTERMDDVAERGQAAHWQYKGVMKKKNTENWLTQVRDILENPDQIKHNLAYKTDDESKKKNIFVFTPKGDLKQLPAGATVLDFAYEIHTDVGSRCKGAIINGKAVPIRYVLQNGEKVDILTAKNQKPKLDWLAFVATGKAQGHIKRQLKEHKYKEAEIGKEMLNRKLKNWKIKSSEDLINMLVRHYKLETGIDLYYMIAEDKLDLLEIKKVLLRFVEAEHSKQKPGVPEQAKESKTVSQEKQDEEILFIGENLKNVNYRLAKCCNPIPGDSVFGFVTTQGGITIHRHNCPNARRLHELYAYRVMPVKWLHSKELAPSVINLKITGRDELGIVGSITKVITDDLRVNMRSINFKTKGKRFEGFVTVMVHDHEHLNQLIYKLKKIQGVEKVVRSK